MTETSTLASYTFDKETGWRTDLPLYIEPGTRVLCLYRVSTAKQLYHDANNEADIPMQRLRCRAFAEQTAGRLYVSFKRKVSQAIKSERKTATRYR